MKTLGIVATSLCLTTIAMTAEPAMLLEDFSSNPEARWTYVADTVMGGVSTGTVEFTSEDGEDFARLTGDVSTDNNGGFVQFRTRFANKLPTDVKGFRLRVRGNGETYHVFLRSVNATRPWHSYRATFTSSGAWSEIDLPLSDFERSNSVLPERIGATEITGMGIVGYGRDFEADVSVASVSLY